MNEFAHPNECEHRPCHCPAEVGSKYCCRQCERANDQTDCNCGHPDCRAEAEI